MYSVLLTFSYCKKKIIYIYKENGMCLILELSKRKKKCNFSILGFVAIKHTIKWLIFNLCGSLNI